MALFIMIAALAAPAAPAHAGFLDWLFGKKGDSALPKMAPFAYPIKKPANDLQALYKKSGTEWEVAEGLNTPHREPQILSTWLVEYVSDIMNIVPMEFEDHVKEIKVGMSPTALSDFQAFMENSKMLETLERSDFKLHAFIDEKPLLLNKGEVNSRYRWLYDLPITLTYLPRRADDYKDSTPVNQYVIVQVQVGRVAPGEGIDELMLESFNVRKNPDKEEG